MSALLIAFNGTTAMGQYLGDTLVSIKAAWLFAQTYPTQKIMLALSPRGELNFLWQRFIDFYKVEVLYDSFDSGNMDQRFAAWDKWHRDRSIEGRKFTVYKELYRRIDGGHRQGKLCGGEAGLGRKNIFEYLYYGQEDVRQPVEKTCEFGTDVIYHEPTPPLYDVLLSPDAKCQGNDVFTHEFWRKVARRLVESGVQVTVNRAGEFLPELKDPLYRKVFPDFKGLQTEVQRHRLVCCGNTGVGWLAGACGIPLLAMQHDESNMQDYRYEWCGVKSLLEFVRGPDVDVVVEKILNFLEQKVVLTTGCFDILHAGHIKHLEESKSYGNRLVVALNSDASVARLKGDGRPVQKQSDRSSVLRALRCVDEVVIFDEDTAMSVVQERRPHVLTNGSDHKIEEVVGREFVEACGGQVIITGGERSVSTSKIIHKITGADVIKACRDAERFSVNPFHKLKFLADQLLSVESIKGAVADVGAYRGGCSVVIRRLSDKVLHVFDTWEGNPFEDPLCHHKKGEWKADLKECQEAVGQDEKTHFHKGVFPKSAADVNGTVFSFVYLDVDTYQSTWDGLEWFWDRLEKGGKLVIDDIPWEPCAGAEKAVDEFFLKERQQRFPDVNAVVVTKT